MAIHYVSDAPGTIKQWTASIAPAGWLIADGSAISRITYANLFSAIGTTYGSGDGVTTFNLPDTRGRNLVGMGQHAEVGTLGNNEGADVTVRRQRHRHTVTDPKHTHTYTNPGGSYGTGEHGGVSGPNSSGNTGASSTGILVGIPEAAADSVDSGGFLTILHIIKY